MNLIDAIAAHQWAITEDGLRTICAIAERENLSLEAVLAKRPGLASPEAIATRSGEWLEGAYDVEIRDGVAILNVRGPLFRYANLFTLVSGATSYEMLAKDFSLARESAVVKAILLNVDSPGGMVNGCAELAELVFSARGDKPIVAYAGGACASGAYWLASAAGELVVAETALVGSIGVILSTSDTRERDSKAGVKTVEIVSSQSPHKTADIATDEGRARIQRIVDDQAEIFVSTVARNRDVNRATVLAKFGQGGVMVGGRAVESGLADRLGSFEGVLAELVERTSRTLIGMPGGRIAIGGHMPSGPAAAAVPAATAPAPSQAGAGPDDASALAAEIAALAGYGKK